MTTATTTSTTHPEKDPTMTDTMPLTHQTWCPKNPRIELTTHPADPFDGRHEAITTKHCLDCGAHWPPARPGMTGALASRPASTDDSIRTVGGHA